MILREQKTYSRPLANSVVQQKSAVGLKLWETKNSAGDWFLFKQPQVFSYFQGIFIIQLIIDSLIHNGHKYIFLSQFLFTVVSLLPWIQFYCKLPVKWQ